MDQIHIRELIVFAHHGLFPEEKTLGQKFIVNATLTLDFNKASTRGDLTASVHYGDLSLFIQRWMNENRYDLLEQVAHYLSLEILHAYPILEKITLEIKKPWAPIALPMDSVSVVVHKQRSRAIISLGTNQGVKEQHLQRALQYIGDHTEIDIRKQSSQVTTKAWGKENQEDFLNMVIQLETTLTPHALLEVLLSIEQQMGRKRIEKWGPRIIDLDIIAFDDLVLQSDTLILPHPYAAERAFVIEPLREICPHFVFPIFGSIHFLPVDSSKF